MIRLKSLLFEQTTVDKIKLIQQELLNNEYELGNTGRNKDGVDGSVGPKTINALLQYMNIEVPDSTTSNNLVTRNTSWTSPGTENFLEFKNELAKQLDFEMTDEKDRFLEAWARLENTRAKNNPYATTMKSNSDPKSSKFNLANSGEGVKNFSTLDYGVDATARTLRLRYYKTLIDKLRNNDITAEELAADPSLNTWGGSSNYSSSVQRIVNNLS